MGIWLLLVALAILVFVGLALMPSGCSFKFDLYFALILDSVL